MPTQVLIVVGSRMEAVRWKPAIDKYIESRVCTIRTLVAFSGEVTDKESGPESRNLVTAVWCPP